MLERSEHFPPRHRTQRTKIERSTKKKNIVPAHSPSNSMTYQEEELNHPSFHMEQPSLDPWLKEEKKKVKKEKKQVLLEGYVETGEAGEEEEGVKSMGRTKSLTGDDLDELKGCLDLGFGFSYEEIPELCNTFPALELCYSMSQRFLDEQQQRGGGVAPVASPLMCSSASSSVPIASWRISGPGDHPEDVKARLKFWAQAVACTVRLCN